MPLEIVQQGLLENGTVLQYKQEDVVVLFLFGELAKVHPSPSRGQYSLLCTMDVQRETGNFHGSVMLLDKYYFRKIQTTNEENEQAVVWPPPPHIPNNENKSQDLQTPQAPQQ